MHEVPFFVRRHFLPCIPENWPRLEYARQLYIASVAHIATMGFWQLFPGLGGHPATAVAQLAIIFFARSVAAFTVYLLLIVLARTRARCIHGKGEQNEHQLILGG